MNTLWRYIQKTYQMITPHEGRTVLSNAAFLSALHTVNYLLPLLLLPYLFQILGASAFGSLALAQGLTIYLNLIIDYSFNVSATRTLSTLVDDKTAMQKLYSHVCFCRALLFLIAALIAVILLNTLPKCTENPTLYLINFSLILAQAFNPSWFFNGVERMHHLARLNIITEFICAFGLFLFIQNPSDAPKVPAIVCAVSLIMNIIGHMLIQQSSGIHLTKPDFNFIKELFKEGWPLFISSLAINAYTNMRIVFIGLLTNNTLTGLYAMAERIAGLIQAFPLNAFLQAIFPRLSHIYSRNPSKALTMMSNMQLITTWLSLFWLPIVGLLAEPLMKIICDGDYGPAVITFRILLVGVFFIQANAFRIQFFLVSGQHALYSKIHVHMALLACPLLYLATSHFSYLGAALMSVIVEAMVCLYATVSLHNILSKKPASN